MDGPLLAIVGDGSAEEVERGNFTKRRALLVYSVQFRVQIVLKIKY